MALTFASVGRGRMDHARPRRLPLLLFALALVAMATARSVPRAVVKRQNDGVDPSGYCHGVNGPFVTRWEVTGLSDCRSWTEAVSLTAIATSPIQCTANNTQADFTSAWGMATELEGILRLPPPGGNMNCEVKLVG
ncbi:MAG: hypothetical protein M1838_004587 [Thelocarpon superellum]|nr:MAG: hypothetical protein M1838_004587 [Thelocarpon superellum]